MSVVLLWSKFLMSVSMWAFIIIALFDLKVDDNGRFRLIFKDIDLQNFIQRRAFLALTFFFWFVLISSAWSSDVGFTLERLRLRLPFLILPLAFSKYPPLSILEKNRIFQVFALFISAWLLGILINYWLHPQEVMHLLSIGKPMPGMRDHIRFSLLGAFAFAVCLEFWQTQTTKTRWYWALLALFLFVGLHILSVRSGIIAVYIVLIFKSLYWIFEQKKYILSILAIALISVAPYIAYQKIGSFRQRIDYMRWDLAMYNQNDMYKKSDSERLVSLKIGIEIFQKNPIFGVGAGDVWREATAIYKRDYPQLEPKIPHNQFIMTLAGMGILGLLGFIGALFYPIYALRKAIFGKTTVPLFGRLFVIFNLIILFSFFIESTIEGAIGIAIYTFFTSLFIYILDKNKV